MLLSYLLLVSLALASAVSPVPLVIDTDIGDDVDDAIAILLAASIPEVRIVAVTTVGRRSLERAWGASKLLRQSGVNVSSSGVFEGGHGYGYLGNATAATTVHAGADSPIDGFFFPMVPLVTGVLDPFEKGVVSDEPAAEALGRIFKVRSDPPVGIVAIGPLTNIATFAERYPDRVKNVGSITVMGGLPRPVNFTCRQKPITSRGDYNLESDRAAALAVLGDGPFTSSGVPVTLVGADVTTLTGINVTGLDALRTSGRPAIRTLVRSIETWDPLFREFCRGRPDTRAMLHDPLTLATAAGFGFVDVKGNTGFKYGIGDDGVFGSYFADEAPQGTEGPFEVGWSAGLPDPEGFDAFVLRRLLGEEE